MTRLAIRDRWPTALLLALCAGIASANWWSPPSAAVIVCAAVAAGWACVSVGSRRVVAVAAVLALAGSAWGGLRLGAFERSVLVDHVGEHAAAVAVVTGATRSTPYAMRLPVEVLRFGDLDLRERALLELPRGRSPPRGAVIELVRVRLVEPRGPETGFDERGWLARRGIHVVLRGDAARVVGRRGGIGGVADRLRAHVERSLALGASGERHALLRGFVLGDDDGVGRALRDAFRASGLAHMAAVSGQNVAIVAGVVGGAAWLAGVGRIGAHLAAIVAILAYALAVGWEPSVVRAAVAGCVASVAWLASRPDDRWHALALGATVLLVWSPASVLEPGFQLSFVAVAAILLTVGRATAAAEGWPVPAWMVAAPTVAAACSIATAPVSWAHFGVISTWSVPANLVAEPAMPVVLALSLAAAAVEPVAPSAATTLTWAAGGAAAWIAMCARLFASLPHAQIRSGWLLVAGLMCVGAGIAIRRAPPWRRRRVTAVVVVAALTAAGALLLTRDRPHWQPPQGLRITFLDVGQGDGALIEAPGAAVLVDQGPPDADVSGQLRALGIRSLSALVLTHPQLDHIGGAPDVLRRLRVGAVWHPGIPVRSPEQQRTLALAAERQVPVVTVHRGERYRIGRLVLEVIWPVDGGPPGADPNLHAVVLLARYGDADALLTADAESDAIGALPLPPVEILKVAHHGSADPGLPRLLEQLRPTIAVISVGAGNDYGHPRADTVDALLASPGLRLYRTDQNGRVVVEAAGGVLSVRSERTPPAAVGGFAERSSRVDR